jgi:predicted RNA-binding Zn-ribbon protein involved in translation (DUF1610 family)
MLELESENVFSFCSRCDEKVELGEEIITEGLIVCKKCFDEILYRCHTCRRLIYKDDLSYEISPY